MFETATRFFNNKPDIPAVRGGQQFSDEFKKLVNELVASKIEAQELSAILGGAGIVNGQPTVQNILARRWGRGA
jgi:hypothetical protein